MQYMDLYPLISAFIGVVLAQVLKPVLYYLVHHQWRGELLQASGGFPSSHTALVTALAMAIGIRDGFASSTFAMAAVFAGIVIYDAANVRYYSGQNIQITTQLVRDVQELLHTHFQDPIYQTKMKEVLGHKWVECFGGAVLGILIALICRLPA